MFEGKSKKTKSKYYWSVGILIAALLITCVIVYVPWSTLYPDEEPSLAKATSTFTLIDYRTGEDVTDWVEISVWTPDDDDLPFDDNDPYIITNFDEEVSSSDANDVTIDLRDHGVAWLEVDPDFESDYGGYNAGAFNGERASRDFRKLFGAANFDYRVLVYHAPENVSVAMLDRGLMGDVIGSGIIGDASPYNNSWVETDADGFMRATDGTYTMYLKMPYESPNGYHAGVDGGDEWDMDDEELVDLLADAAIHDWDIDHELLWLQDQSNHRTIAPLYDLTDDTENDYISDIEKVTNCFAVRITMNTTISETDGNAAQVNFTIMDRDYNYIPAEVIYDAASIWVVFYEPITCYDQLYNFDVRFEFGTALYIASVTTNWLITPQDDDNLGAAALLNTMFLDLHV